MREVGTALYSPPEITSISIRAIIDKAVGRRRGKDGAESCVGVKVPRVDLENEDSELISHNTCNGNIGTYTLVTGFEGGYMRLESLIEIEDDAFLQLLSTRAVGYHL
jgi:hypothetical protein